MIFLASTTDKLQLISSSGAALDVNVNFVDLVKTTGAWFDADRQNTTITSATTTDILAAPASGKVRTAKQITVRNKDATLACDVTLLIDANGTDFEFHQATLQPKEMLIYIEGIGFFTNTKNTLLHKVLFVTGSDVSNSTTSFADVTGLTCPLKSGKRYLIQGLMHVIAAATTTGVQIGYNIGAAPTVAQFSADQVVTNSATAAAVSTGSATARDTAFIVQTTGPAAVGPCHFFGMIQPSADGTFAVRMASEVAASAVTSKIGSALVIMEER